MSDKPTLQEILEVQQHFGLPSPALVEKDFYVVKALAAIASLDAAPFRLVFGGGTALGRAYGLLNRMSEDIDLKIVSEKPPTRGMLRPLRRKVTDALLGAGFVFDPENSKHRFTKYEGRFTRYQLPYTPIAEEGQGALRPQIQIDTAVFPLRRETADRPVMSFIAEGLGRPAEVEKIACTSVLESMAEKFVALTRRAGEELAGLQDPRDPTLVRHLYDLHALRDENGIAEFATLAREVMVDDAKTYGGRFPAYKDNPLAETLRAIEGIAKDAVFADGYAAFRRDMIYGEAPDFAAVTAHLKELGAHIERA